MEPCGREHLARNILMLYIDRGLSRFERND